jgi:hypothetical protein
VIPVGTTPGANPTIASYNASVVNFYNATGSLVRFENKKNSSTLKNAVACYNAGVVAVNSKVAGLAPALRKHFPQFKFFRELGPPRADKLSWR